jgi:hypothetical protein
MESFEVIGEITNIEIIALEGDIRDAPRLGRSTARAAGAR